MEDFFEEQVNETEYFNVSQYLKGVLKRWWIVLIITGVISIPWIIYLKGQPPVFEAETWISFENVGGAVPENLIQSRIMKLKSRSFAEEVTAELGLTLELTQKEGLPEIKRQDIFQKFSTTMNPVAGFYSFHISPKGYCALFYENELLDSLRTEKIVGDTIEYNGIIFKLNPDVIHDRSQIDFRIKDFRETVRSLISRENIRTSGNGDLMRITLSDADPHLASRTVNMLAEIFIKKSIEMGKEANRFMRNYLENQLSVVQQQLNQSDYQLKKFRNTHLIGLDRETQDIMASLDGIDRNIHECTLNKEELGLLLNKLDPSVSDFEAGMSTRYIYSQLASQPVFEGDAEMAVARQELNELYQQRRDLHQRGFPELNPVIMEISEKVTLVEEKIYRLSKAKVLELEKQIADLENQKTEFHKELDTHPEEELKLIKLTRQRTANEEIYELLLKRYKEAQISEAVASENVSILDPAIPPSRPISAGKKKKAVFGFILGLFLGIGVSLILEITDKSIKTQEDVKRYLKLPILGVIPNVKFDNYEIQDSEKAKSISSQIVTHDYSPTPVGEAYRSLRTALLFSKKVGTIRSLVISSVFPSEGKSFTAANVAITLAQQKSKTLLIDADLRRGVLHNNFNCPKKPGLTNYLTGVVPLETILNETYVPNLSLITCGSLIPNPSELLGSEKMKRFIEGITKRFDFVVFDTPPLIAATDAVVLGTFVDGVSVVVRAGKTKREEVQRKLELFNNVQARMIGIILNGAGIEIAHEGYSYYSY